MSQPSQERREEVESVIRACLVSRQGDVTIQHLLSDYLEYEGEPIPFREFNYTNVFDFLSSLTNVLKLITKFNHTYIQVIDTERTRHVSSLVEGQKPSKKRPAFPKRFKKPFRGGYNQARRPCNLYSSPRNLGSFRVPVNRSFNNSYAASNDYHQVPVMADRNSQTNSNETCSSQQETQIIFTGEDPNDFADYDDDLIDLINHVKSSPPPTPSKKSSCQSASSFLSRTLSSAENHNKSIKYTGLPIVDSTNHKSDSTNHKSDSTNYKSDSPNHKSDSTNYKSDLTNRKSDSTNYINDFTSYKDKPVNYKNNSTNGQSDSNQYQNPYSRRCNGSTNHESYLTEDYHSPKSVYKNGYDSTKQEKYSTDNHQNHSSRNIYENRSNSYYNETSAKSQNEKHSPKKTPEKRSERNDVYASNASCNGINIENEDFEEDYEDYDCDEIKLDINARVKERLRIIIQQHPEGIWCSELPKVYFESSSVPLNFEELGFQSVVQFAFKLPDIFHCVCPTQGGEYKLYNAQKPLPDLKNPEQRCQYSSAEQYRLYDYEDPEPLPTRLDPSVIDNLIPEGVMLTAERVGKILVSEFQDNVYVEVVLSEVFNPSFFWIQLRRRLPKFKKFMDDMHAFYEEEKGKFRIPNIILNKGLNVACIYAKKWHRGIIKTVLPDSVSLVHFYDYGTVKSYQPGELYYLHRRFSFLPAQAIPCGLYNLRPYNCDKWRKEITWKFIEKTSCPLIAEIISKNDEENSALITLTDTQKDDDFHINDWMHSEKLAAPGDVNIDLKNLIDYEEDKLPRKDDVYEEDYEPKAKGNSQHPPPPPGFSPLNTIIEESSNILNGLPKNLAENNNSKMEGKGFIDLQRKIQSQLSPIEYEAFLQHLFKSFQISNSSGDESHNSSKIISETPEFTNVDAQKNVATPLNYNSNSSHANETNSLPANSNLSFISTNVEEFFKGIPKLNENTKNQGNHSNNRNVNLTDQLSDYEKRLIQEVSNSHKILEQQKKMERRAIPNYEKNLNYDYVNSLKNLEQRENLDRRKIPNYQEDLTQEHQNGHLNLEQEKLRNSGQREIVNHNDLSQGYKHSQIFAEQLKNLELKKDFNKERIDYFRNLKPDSPKANEDLIKFPEPETELKETNPFKMVLKKKNLSRVNLKSFFDSPFDELSSTNETKTESNTLNTNSQLKPNFFSLGENKEKNTNRDFVNEKKEFIPSNIFSPVTNSCVNKSSDIFYESGPVMYNRNGPEIKTDMLDPKYWKPIPSAETSGTSKSPVKENGFSFKVNESKTPVEQEDFYSLHKEAGSYPLPSSSENSRSPTPTKQNIFFPPTVEYQNPSVNVLNDKQKSGYENIFCPPTVEYQNPSVSVLNDKQKSCYENIFSSPTVEYQNPSVNVLNEKCLNDKQNSGYQYDAFAVNDNRAGDLASNVNLSHHEASCEKRSEVPQRQSNNKEMYEQAVFNSIIEQANKLNNTNPFKSPVKLDNSSVCYMYPIKTKEMSIIIINMDNEGWLITEEFLEAFTHLKGTSIMLKALEFVKTDVPFKEVTRLSHPSLLSQLDFTPLKALRNTDNKICRPVHLTPLRWIPKILINLKIINRLEWQATAQGKKISADTVVNDIIKLISSYGTYMGARGTP